MDIGIISRSLYALSVVGLLLFGLWWMARQLGRKRVVQGIDQRLVTVIETTYLSQQAMMHVVRIGTRYFAIGGGASGLTMIAELDHEPLDTYVEQQRRLLEDQRASVNAIFKRIRGNSG